jgi:hypothetical protein
VDRLSALRAVVTFHARVGRAPKRLDLRPPDREKWEKLLACELPSESYVHQTFGGMLPFLHEAGLTRAPRFDFADVEHAAVAEAQRLYPELELVRAEANHFDGFLANGQKLEIKGAHLSEHINQATVPPLLVQHFNFKTHRRDYQQTIDRMLCVGVGSHPDTQQVQALVVLDFPKPALDLVSNKASVRIHAASVWGYGASIYSPYVRYKLDLQGQDPRAWLRRGPPPKDSEEPA